MLTLNQSSAETAGDGKVHRICGNRRIGNRRLVMAAKCVLKADSMVAMAIMPPAIEASNSNAQGRGGVRAAHAW